MAAVIAVAVIVCRVSAKVAILLRGAVGRVELKRGGFSV
jgi:hypothetical protein